MGQDKERERKREIVKMYNEFGDLGRRIFALADQFSFGEMEKLGMKNCDQIAQLLYKNQDFQEAREQMAKQVAAMKISSEDL